MSNNLPSKILVVDSDQGVLNALKNGLQSYKIEVLAAKDWESALYLYNQNRFELCIVSLELPSMPGTVLIQKWRSHEMESKQNAAFILTTSVRKTSSDVSLVKELGDIMQMIKPLKVPPLLSAMANALKLSKDRYALVSIQKQVIQPLIDSQQTDQALAIARKSLDPLGDRGLFASAKIHAEAGKYEEASIRINSLLKKDPHNMSYHNELGRLFLKQGDLNAAQKAFETADSAAPSNLNRLKDMAQLYLKLKMPDKSVEKFKEILELDPENDESKFEMYNQICDAGFLEHAQQFCKETSTPMELVRHFNNKGVVYSKKGEFVDAIDEYAKATRLIPGAKELHRILYNMAIAHINLKTFEHLQTAHKLLEQCLELEPSFTKAKDKMEITKKYAPLNQLRKIS